MIEPVVVALAFHAVRRYHGLLAGQRYGVAAVFTDGGAAALCLALLVCGQGVLAFALGQFGGAFKVAFIHSVCLPIV